MPKPLPYPLPTSSNVPLIDSIINFTKTIEQFNDCTVQKGTSSGTSSGNIDQLFDEWLTQEGPRKKVSTIIIDIGTIVTKY